MVHQRRWMHASLGWAFAALVLASPPLLSKERSHAVTSKTAPLPFGLQGPQALGKVVVTVELKSTKTGAGRQSITLGGTGEVTLTKTLGSADPQAQILKGTIDPGVVVRLLDLMEGAGFLDLHEQYPAEGMPEASRRTVTLRMPGREKSVAVTGRGLLAVEDIITAIKFSAALGVPEAINHRFFANL